MRDDSSAVLLRCIERVGAGDDAAREELIVRCQDRLLRLTRRMLQDFRRVRRWEQSGDVLQNATLRLLQALRAVKPASAREFFALATLQIRRELLDLARHYHGPLGLGANHASVAGEEGQPQIDQPASGEGPDRLAAWSELHAQAEALPAEEREVFDLLWYQELSQDETAAVLGTSASTVRRRWRSALLKLHEVLHGELPEA